MSLTMKFSPRELMERAIDVMRDSVNEPREDDKVSPLVGAVLFKPDGTIKTACRGELRYGDHAEYTLLERKNRDVRLDGSILFATLEPCAPGSRAHQKLPCAERIFLARIQEVWIGIEDPDPTVDRKGIKYLQDHGVTVHMFDRDLQEVIREENKEFIALAVERAAAAEEEKPRKITLSQFENPIAVVAAQDFLEEALEGYRICAKIEDGVGSPAFSRRLEQQGILANESGKLHPTGYGLILFGKEPRNVIPQAGLLGTIHYPEGKEELRDFDGPAVLIPDLVEDWLTSKLPNVIDRSRMRREEVPPLPFEMVREAVVNALIHRDYEIAGAKCQLIVDEHTVVVMSPGPPPPPITVQQLQSFNAPMLSRNPGLHYVFAKMELAEERGWGIKSLKSQAQEAGLPLPKYVFNDPYLELTLYRSPESALAGLSEEMLATLTADERKGWEFLSLRMSATRREYETHLGIDRRTAQRHLQKLVDLGLLRRVGAGPSTRYEVGQP